MAPPSRDCRLGPAWSRSSFSTGGNNACVEVRQRGELVSIRDSKYRRSPTSDPVREPVIAVTAQQWTAFVDQLTGQRGGDAVSALVSEPRPDGSVALRSASTGTTLTFTPAEWRAFLAGLDRGELQVAA